MNAAKAVIPFWLKSAMLWILAFCLLCIMLAFLVPSRWLSAADGVNGSLRVLVTKLAAFLPSAENPDVVVMGSSLVLTPAVRCDDKLAGKVPCYERWYYDRYIPEYTESVYFEKKLKDDAGLHLKIKNLGVASSIMSDQFGIFRLMLNEKKQPKLLILGLAPRDFLDNTQQHHLETPTRQFIREYEQDSLWPEKWSATEIKNTATKVEHKLEKVIAKVRTTALSLACNLSGHQARAEYNVNGYEGDHPNRLKDLETYRRLYNPPNYTMLAQQSSYLRKLLVAAANHNVRVLIVNMPLTKENIACLDAHAYQEYVASLKSLSSEFNAGFLDIGSQQRESYSLADFEDCCHLNARGGEKFYESLSASILADQKIVSSLKGKTSARQSIAADPAKSLAQ